MKGNTEVLRFAASLSRMDKGRILLRRLMERAPATAARMLKARAGLPAGTGLPLNVGDRGHPGTCPVSGLPD